MLEPPNKVKYKFGIEIRLSTAETGNLCIYQNGNIKMVVCHKSVGSKRLMWKVAQCIAEDMERGLSNTPDE